MVNCSVVKKSLLWGLTSLCFVSTQSCDSNNNTTSNAHSIARQWNDVLLEGIRNDFARPTVHARNLFHSSAAMYDAWGAYSTSADTYLLGRGGIIGCEEQGDTFKEGFKLNNQAWVKSSRAEAISHASYRVIQHRFAGSPGSEATLLAADQLMLTLGYDIKNVSADIYSGSAAALGNYIGNCYINYGLTDGSNEAGRYKNRFYETVNIPLSPELPGNPNITDLNRWQPLALELFIDQAGVPIVGGALEFLGPEWGSVQPFSLSDSEISLHYRGDDSYKVYHDPGAPPLAEGDLSDAYKWGFSLVAQWSSHLDPNDGVMWDISPASVGNVGVLPTDPFGYPNFYNAVEGGDSSQGRVLNPSTGEAYKEQWVPRGDYTRVLAEFWADGPDSETPPGHWFVILNTVNDHPKLKRKFRGQGEEMDTLEWDVKSYFTLGGAMHDSAISAWGIKGWYDYIRPISAIRAMADFGQSSDPDAASYHPNGIPLSEGFIELVPPGDVLAGYEDQFAGKIKVRVWQGPEFVVNPLLDTGDVGWILAEDWWPYQRPSFVTPPFAGYVSGHSTYSRAAAEVMTLLTGDEYFPGGKSEFSIKANEFLVFEQGPSVDMTLEWATYRDASDQCSLSRIWGGIHPPADDIPGRIIGERIGIKAFAHAESYFNGQTFSE